MSTNLKYLIATVLSILLAAFAVGAQTRSETLRFDFTETNDLTWRELAGGVTEFTTTGGDPYVFTHPLTRPRPEEAVVLAFEYFCPEGLDHFQVFFGTPREAHSRRVRNVGPAEGWVAFAVDLSEDLKGWGQAGETLRLDWGGKPEVNIQVRNVHFREMTERERELAATREERRRADALLNEQLTEYLATEFPARMTLVTAQMDSVVLFGEGDLAGRGTVFVGEVMPHQDVTQMSAFAATLPLREDRFRLEVERFVERDGATYDRALSKWVIVQANPNNGYELLSHARYPDSHFSLNAHRKPVLRTKKGLGGFHPRHMHVSDVDDLDITSATINILVTNLMRSQPGPNTLSHDYHGEAFYFDREAVSKLDDTLRFTHERDMVTAAVLLIQKAVDVEDPVIGRIFEHPDCDPAGIYSMPDLTNPKSVRYYAAALDFIASRYNRPDARYGRLHHFIMHNEVDAGWVWTNAGDKPALAYFDIYHKSMRMGNAILRRYHPHGETFISLTHYWAWTSHPKFYPPKELMGYLLQYTHAEGDFPWAIAYHPYPQSLFEPKTWLDDKATWSFDTDLITFKNLEVLEAWVRQPEALYLGREVRTVWLSENGTNSRDYSEQSLAEQAAGFAYTWKKFKHLDALQGFQWHNWYDHPDEGGLRIGLRKFTRYEEDPGGRKPVWYLYQAAGTEREDEVFEPYLEIIGISDWDEVLHRGPIE